MSPRILVITAARGGSKSVPRKNLADIGGKPMIAHIIAAALRVPLITDFIVSTEDAEIAKVAQSYGAKVPFLRPPELAGDLVPSEPVLQHALREMENRTGAPYDYVALCQTTAPLTRSEDIEACLKRLIKGDCDSVVSCVRVTSYHPFRLKRIINGDIMVNYIDQGFEDMRPRQILPPVYKRSGGIYASKRHILMDLNAIVGPDARAIIVPDETAIDVDSEADLVVARFLYNKLNQR